MKAGSLSIGKGLNMTPHMILTGTVVLDATEDRGQALIAKDIQLTPDLDEGFFIRLQSWDKNKGHSVFRWLEGKRVKITIEVLA